MRSRPAAPARSRSIPADAAPSAARPGFDSSPAAQVRVESPFTSMYEAVNVLKRMKQGLLHKVGGVGEIASLSGEAAAGPSTQRRRIAGKQLIKRAVVAGAGARAARPSTPCRVVSQHRRRQDNAQQKVGVRKRVCGCGVTAVYRSECRSGLRSSDLSLHRPTRTSGRSIP
jgi:hypothetical protein